MLSPDGAEYREPSVTRRLRDRILVSLSVACGAALIAAYTRYAKGDPQNASDFTWYWRAGRAVLEGLSPYQIINPTGPYPYDAGFLYPFPAALISAPFALLALWPAMVLFSGVLAGCLTFALSRDGFWRLPLLMSFPMLWCVQSGQLTPLAVAAAFIPALGGFGMAKPTIAIAAFAYAPTKRFVISAIVVVLISLAIAPGWPNEYVREVGARTASNYRVPLLVIPGFLVVLAALRWRRPEARLLLAMACVPQTMLFYDQLPLLTLARTFRQALVLALGSYLPIVVIYFLPRVADDSLATTLATTSRVIVWVYYVPCLIEVLRRPNVGYVPQIVEQVTARLPGWLRGQRPADAAT